MQGPPTCLATQTALQVQRRRGERTWHNERTKATLFLERLSPSASLPSPVFLQWPEVAALCHWGNKEVIHHVLVISKEKPLRGHSWTRRRQKKAFNRTMNLEIWD